MDENSNSKNPILKWALIFAALGMFAGFILGLDSGGSIAFSFGMSLPIGIIGFFIGLIFGFIIKIIKK
jgi:hypothetical protein